MNIDKDGEYKTKDLPEVAALIIKKQRLIKMQRDGSVCWFVFEHTPLCEEIVHKFYYEGLPHNNVREYSETLKMLKGKVTSY